MKSKHALAVLLVLSLGLFAFIDIYDLPITETENNSQTPLDSNTHRSDTILKNITKPTPINSSFNIPKAADVSWHVRDFQ